MNSEMPILHFYFYLVGQTLNNDYQLTVSWNCDANKEAASSLSRCKKQLCRLVSCVVLLYVLYRRSRSLGNVFNHKKK